MRRMKLKMNEDERIALANQNRYLQDLKKEIFHNILFSIVIFNLGVLGSIFLYGMASDLEIHNYFTDLLPGIVISIASAVVWRVWND